MKRRQGWLFFIIFLLTLSVYLLINYPLQLGLDLQGGSQLTLQIIKEEGKVTRDELEAVNSVIDKRVNNLGVSESNLQTLGGDQLILELPGEQNPLVASRVLGKTALLEFRTQKEGTSTDLKTLQLQRLSIKELIEEYTKYNLKGWESKKNVFDSDADIVDHQVAIIEYENGATLAFHTNMRVPDEFRRFAVIGTNGMVEGDFVRGFLKAHDQQNNIILDEDYGAAFGMVKGHYGADNLMLKDINQNLTNSDKINLPVGVKDCIEAGVVAMKLDESRKTGKIIDLTSSWNRLDKEMKK